MSEIAQGISSLYLNSLPKDQRRNRAITIPTLSTRSSSSECSPPASLGTTSGSETFEEPSASSHSSPIGRTEPQNLVGQTRDQDISRSPESPAEIPIHLQTYEVSADPNPHVARLLMQLARDSSVSEDHQSVAEDQTSKNQSTGQLSAQNCDEKSEILERTVERDSIASPRSKDIESVSIRPENDRSEIKESTSEETGDS